METALQIVILAAGDFPMHPIPLRALHEADFVVFCDSAYNQFSILHPQLSIPFAVIGDGDSLSESDKEALDDHWIKIEEQDYNDLHKAMQYATTKFPNPNSRFSILGATGRREDHTIGNISYLVTFAAEYPDKNIEMLTDYGQFSLVRGSRTFTSFPRQQVSIFSLKPDSPVTATGLRWPLDQKTLTLWWEGTLNEALSTTFYVEGDNILVFQTYDPK